MSKSKLDHACDRFICGNRGSYYWLHPCPDINMGGGNFFYKEDYRQHMKDRLRDTINNDHVLLQYLTLVDPNE